MPSINVMLLALAVGVTLVSAHGFVQEIVINGKSYSGYLVNQFPYESDPPEVIGWSTTATDLGFVAPDAYGSGDIICHRGAKNAAVSAEVAPGDEIELLWTTWPDSHHGPVIDYLAKCDGDCATVDKTTLEFFKINAVGLIDDTTVPGDWGSDSLIASNNSWTTTIPADLAPGNYVLRHEIIALHSAGNTDGAQNYPQCINLIVTGSGTKTYTGTAGESLYQETDPGILINIYQSLSTYTIPGPTLIPDATTGNKASTAAPTATGTAISYTAGSVATAAATNSAVTTASVNAAETTTTAAPKATTTTASTTKHKCKRQHPRDINM